MRYLWHSPCYALYASGMRRPPQRKRGRGVCVWQRKDHEKCLDAREEATGIPHPDKT